MYGYAFDDLTITVIMMQRLTEADVDVFPRHICVYSIVVTCATRDGCILTCATCGGWILDQNIESHEVDTIKEMNVSMRKILKTIISQLATQGISVIVFKSLSN